eukprot:scaffold117395_cov33-Tisochrysis_lutea.AAC.2
MSGLELRKARHCLEAQIADIRFSDGDKTAEQINTLLQHLAVRAKVDAKIDRLKQDRMRGVVFVHVLRHLRASDDPLEDLRDAKLERVLSWGWEVLQNAQQLDLEPGSRDAIVEVVV